MRFKIPLLGSYFSTQYWTQVCSLVSLIVWSIFLISDQQYMVEYLFGDLFSKPTYVGPRLLEGIIFRLSISLRRVSWRLTRCNYTLGVLSCGLFEKERNDWKCLIIYSGWLEFVFSNYLVPSWTMASWIGRKCWLITLRLQVWQAWCSRWIEKALGSKRFDFFVGMC